MEQVVRERFTQNTHLARCLIETKDKVLAEGNYRNNLYWGFDPSTGEGENHLGQILMALRAVFQNGIPKEAAVGERQLFGPINGVSVVYGDITQSDCECIVNAAKRHRSQYAVWRAG